MSPKQRFPVMLEPEQIAAMRAIEERTGAPVSEQIRRAIDGYLSTQKVLSRGELKALRGDE